MRSVDVQFNMGVIFGAGVAADPDTNISYIGDITFRGHDDTLVSFSITPPEPGCTVCYAEETWSIYDSVDDDFGVVDIPGVGPVPGVLTSSEAGELVFAGSDRAVGTSTGSWVGSGPITEAGSTTDGPLEHVTSGRVLWYGSYDTDEIGPGTRFAGRFVVVAR